MLSRQIPTTTPFWNAPQKQRSDYLVTGDDDLLRLGQFEGMPIVKVADFLKVARGESRGR
jgi:predicted nucleic acid-binding protein